MMRIGATAVLMLGMFWGPHPAGPVEETPHPVNESALSGAEAVSVDASMYARQVNTSLSEATERIESQLELAPLVDLLAISAGDRFAGWWFVHSPGFRVVLRLTEGPRLPVVEAGLRDLGESSEALYSGAFNEQELVVEAQKVADRLDGSSGVDGVSVDVRSGEVVVTVSVLDPTVDTVLASRPATSVPLRLESGMSPARSDAYGGTRLSNTCTSGFTVRNANNVRGFLTAGHCGDSTTYALSPTGTPSWPSTLFSVFHNRYADMQWHRADQTTAVGQFFGQSDTQRTTRTGSGTPGVNQFVCHRGRVSGYSCGFVNTLSYRPTYSGACGSGPCDPVFVRVQGPALQASGGDSGGPWFSGGTAYGIHMGSQSTTTGYAFFSRITYTANMALTLL